MTTNDSKFNLPTHTITADELRLSMPKAQRIRKVTQVQSAPPSEELMAELRTLLSKLDPDDSHPQRSWIRVLMGIFDATDGGPEGFALADKWSSRGRRYKGTAGVWKYWKRLKSDHANPVTIRSLRWMVDEKSA